MCNVHAVGSDIPEDADETKLGDGTGEEVVAFSRLNPKAHLIVKVVAAKSVGY
jgi:hypothetical protein